RGALRSAGRHHQPERIFSGQFHRDRDLGVGRRTRDLAGARSRRDSGQPCQDLADRGRAGDVAVRSWRDVRLDDARLPAWHCRADAAPGPHPAGRGGPGSRPRAGMKTAAPLTDALLYLNGVTVSFDGFKALNDLSLVVEEGELRTIIGPNGA